jgi:hypothetical protein
LTGRRALNVYLLAQTAFAEPDGLRKPFYIKKEHFIMYEANMDEKLQIYCACLAKYGVNDTDYSKFEDAVKNWESFMGGDKKTEADRLCESIGL